jgi:hypothetical protein
VASEVLGHILANRLLTDNPFPTDIGVSKCRASLCSCPYLDKPKIRQQNKYSSGPSNSLEDEIAWRRVRLKEGLR